MSISFIAFILLWKTQRKTIEKTEAKKVIAGENVQSALLTFNNDQIIVENEEKVKEKVEEKFDLKTIIYLSIILWTSVLLIGCIPSINSYSLNPYGASTFHYVIIACKFYSKNFSRKFFFKGQCCYPVVSFCANFFPKLFEATPIVIIVTTVSGTLAFVYIFLTGLFESFFFPKRKKSFLLFF
jgi:hypothetical protein